MSPHDADRLTPDEARAREAVRALAPPRADPAYRERLRSHFVTGRIEERRVLELPLAWHRRRAWRLALAPAAAALLAVAAMIANRGPAWRVVAARGDGVAVVDRHAVPLGHAEALQRRLRPGARLTVPSGAELEVASEAGLVVQVTAGTEFTLPGPPGRWLGRRVAGAVASGEIRVTTGPAFRGALLRIDTPEAAVEVSGTTLAVICEPVGTCVCVLEGAVRVAPRGGPALPVAGGSRRFVFNDGRLPETEAIRALENGELARFRDRRRAWLERVAR